MTDTAERQTPERARGTRAPGVWTVLVLVLVAVGAVILIERDVHEVSASDRGSLTSAEYLTAAGVARTEITQQQASVTTAVATVVRRTDDVPTMSPGCTSDRLLVVSLVGDFPDIQVGSPQPSSGPDMWVTVKADATTGQTCLSGVSLGHFTKPDGAADLDPVL